MTGKTALRPPGVAWIREAIIPGWMMFRYSFVRASGLTPAVFFGRVGGYSADRCFNGAALFPNTMYWAHVDITSPGAHPVEVYQSTGDDEVAWTEIQDSNTVAWSPDVPTYIAFAGSDSMCLLAPRERIEAAFGVSLSALDQQIKQCVEKVFHRLDSEQPNSFDRVWCGVFAWMNLLRS